MAKVLHKGGVDGEQGVVCLCILKEELQQLESTAAHAVFVQDHNLPDHSWLDAFQKGS